MFIKCSLKVSAEDFFSVVENSLRYELEHFGGKAAGTYEITPGMAYSKLMKHGNQTNRAIVKLTEFQPGEVYQTRIKSDDGRVFEITYRFTPTGTDSCELAYSEEVLDSGEANSGFRMLLFGWVTGHSMKRQFRQIEKTIRKKRKEQ